MVNIFNYVCTRSAQTTSNASESSLWWTTWLSNFFVDEYKCHKYSCTLQFRCKGERSCLHFTSVCNKRKDCTLNDDESYCDYIACPLKCMCRGYGFDCSATNISIIPSLPSNIRLLILARNTIHILATTLLTNLKLLYNFDVSDNHISKIAPNTFLKLDHLILLDLGHNNINLTLNINPLERTLLTLNILLLWNKCSLPFSTKYFQNLSKFKKYATAGQEWPVLP